jgi:hypothetical protein
MTGLWLITKNGEPVIKPSIFNNHDIHTESWHVESTVWDVMMECKHGDKIELFCEVPGD